MNAVIPTETWLHKFNDWAPFIGIMLTFLGGIVSSVVFVTRQQTKKIERIFTRLNAESMRAHNANGAAHVTVAHALREERGALFREIGEQIADQNVALARIEERGDMTAEQLGALVEAHNATISDANQGGCRVIPTKVRVRDPNYCGPFRRKTDPPGRG